METKRCTRCALDQPVDRYLTLRSKKTGRVTLSSWCRDCRSAAARAARHQRPDVYRAADKRRKSKRRENPEHRAYQAAYKRARRKTDKGKREVRGFKLRVYGLTHEDYDHMLAEQDGHCAICPAVPPEGTYLHIDHCHTTGRTRKLLCPGCNQGLGNFDDDIERLLAAADYLREFAAT